MTRPAGSYGPPSDSPSRWFAAGWIVVLGPVAAYVAGRMSGDPGAAEGFAFAALLAPVVVVPVVPARRVTFFGAAVAGLLLAMIALPGTNSTAEQRRTLQLMTYPGFSHVLLIGLAAQTGGLLTARFLADRDGRRAGADGERPDPAGEPPG